MAISAELNSLLESGVHFGHKAKRWNPKMGRFIFGKRSSIYIIDLEKTLEKIKEAQAFLSEVIKEGKDILFVGTKKQAQGIIADAAQACRMPYVTYRWVGGMLTNFDMVRPRVDKYKSLLIDREQGKFDKLPKKEVVRLNKKLEKMERNFSGVKDMYAVPGAFLVVDPKKEMLAVREAKKMKVPIVALIDTDSDPEIIDYPIPGNDDALKSIRAVLSLLLDPLKEIISEGKEEDAPDQAEDKQKEEGSQEGKEDNQPEVKEEKEEKEEKGEKSK